MSTSATGAPVTVTEVAARLHTSRWAVLRLVKSGQLAPVQKLPGETGAYLFDPAVVEALAVERGERVAS